MKLVKPFVYISPSGERWEAPVGAVIDGASIPRIAWTVIGGPYEGLFREASVIHDVACDLKVRPWQDVHRVFYSAMRASGVWPWKAKVMYAAVFHFGPRWSLTSGEALTKPSLTIENFRELVAQINERHEKAYKERFGPAPRFTTREAYEEYVDTVNQALEPVMSLDEIERYGQR